MTIEYISGAELPEVHITWRDSEEALIDFSGWTFTVRIGQLGQAAVLEKTSGITGSASAPNVVIAWDADELDGLNAATYQLQVRAREPVTNRDRKMQTPLTINQAVLAAT